MLFKELGQPKMGTSKDLEVAQEVKDIGGSCCIVIKSKRQAELCHLTVDCKNNNSQHQTVNFLGHCGNHNNHLDNISNDDNDRNNNNSNCNCHKTQKNDHQQQQQRRRALITGINGQVGSYLAEFLLGKGYHVHGMIRRESSLNGCSGRLDHLFEDKTNRKSVNLELHYGDLTDGASLLSLICRIKPHEIYNLAAQSHVKISFEMSEMTANTNALGTLRLLEAIRQYEYMNISPDLTNSSNTMGRVRIYQASTSELFGGSINQVPQNEKTPFHPRSPYGCSKLFAHSLVVNYRESYGMFATNGILFNHESPRRGENFVTRKISRSVAKIKLGKLDHFELGNLDSKRDWGHARDYVEAMWLMLQKQEAKDYVIASGESHSVREFVMEAFQTIGLQITWSGIGLNEIGTDQDGIVRVKVSEKFFRPAEVDHLLGDASLARKELGWKPKTLFNFLVREMVESDIKLLVKNHVA